MTLAALTELAAEGAVPAGAAAEAIDRYGHRPRQARPRPRLREGHAMTAATQTATEVKVPDIGDFSDVPIIEVHVNPGDEVNADDPLVTLESDKATMDVPSPAAARSPRCWSRSATRSARARRS